MPISSVVLDGSLDELAISPVAFRKVGVGVLHPQRPELCRRDAPVAQAVDKGDGLGPADLAFGPESAVLVAHDPASLGGGIDIIVSPVGLVNITEGRVLRLGQLGKGGGHGRELRPGDSRIGLELPVPAPTEDARVVADRQLVIIPHAGGHVGEGLFCQALLGLRVYAVVQPGKNRHGLAAGKAAVPPHGLVRVAHDEVDFFLGVDMVGSLGKALKLIPCDGGRVLDPA